MTVELNSRNYIAIDNRHFLKYCSTDKNESIVGLCLMLFKLDSFSEQKEENQTIIYNITYK